MNQDGGIISYLFELLDKKGMVWAALRNYESLPGAPPQEGDVDLLIDKKNRFDFLPVLEAVLNESRGNLLLKISQPNCISYLVMQPDFRTFWIDACTDISSKGFIFADSGFLLKTRMRNEKGFYTVSGGGEAATIFVKEIFSHPYIKEKYLTRIPKLALSDKENFIGTLKFYFDRKTIEELFQICSSSQWEQGIRKRKIWFLGLVFSNFFKKPVRQIADSSAFIFSRLKLYFPNRGRVVAVIGPDGVGKTTISDKLKTWAQRLFFHRIYTYHGHPGLFPEWGNIYRFIFGKNAKSSSSVNNEVGVMRAIFSIFYYGLEYLFFWPWVYWSKLRGSLLIFDRYFYDFITLKNKNYFVFKIFFILSRIIPRPDLLFILETDPETIFRRKNELGLAEIKRQLDFFRNKKIASLVPTVFIDVRESPEVILGKIGKELIKNLPRI